MAAEVKKQSINSMKELAKKLGQFKYPLLILLLGVLLVLWPFGGSQKKSADEAPQSVVVPVQAQKTYVEQTEEKLATVLSCVEGAGKVEVMLTVRGSDVTYYQTDNDSASEESEGNQRTSTQNKTVILSGNGEYDKAAVIKTEYPAFQGALIVSQGAEDAGVRLALVNAVSSLLGLGTDKISVVKMK